jgi:hypothetical protein
MTTLAIPFKEPAPVVKPVVPITEYELTTCWTANSHSIFSAYDIVAKTIYSLTANNVIIAERKPEQPEIVLQPFKREAGEYFMALYVDRQSVFWIMTSRMRYIRYNKEGTLLGIFTPEDMLYSPTFLEGGVVAGYVDSLQKRIGFCDENGCINNVVFLSDRTKHPDDFGWNMKANAAGELTVQTLKHLLVFNSTGELMSIAETPQTYIGWGLMQNMPKGMWGFVDYDTPEITIVDASLSRVESIKYQHYGSDDIGMSLPSFVMTGEKEFMTAGKIKMKFYQSITKE